MVPNMYVWPPPHVCMVPPHVQYDVIDSYGPPYLIWNRYLMVPLTLYGTYIVWSPTCNMVPHMYDLMVSLTLYGTCIVWSPTCMYGPPTCMYGPPHVQYDF